MHLSKEEYFFIEWLIVGKGMSEETFSKLSRAEVEELRAEWKARFDKQ